MDAIRDEMDSMAGKRFENMLILYPNTSLSKIDEFSR